MDAPFYVAFDLYRNLCLGCNPRRNPVPCEKTAIFRKDNTLQHFPCLRIKGVCYVLIFSVRSLAAGHCNGKAVFPFKDFDIMHDETFVDRDRHHCFQFSCGIADLPNTYIIDFHKCIPLKNASLYSLYYHEIRLFARGFSKIYQFFSKINYVKGLCDTLLRDFT